TRTLTAAGRSTLLLQSSATRRARQQRARFGRRSCRASNRRRAALARLAPEEIAERGVDRAIAEAKAERGRARGHDALAVDEQLGELAQRGAQQPRREGERQQTASERDRKRRHELRVTHGRRRRGVDR